MIRFSYPIVTLLSASLLGPVPDEILENAHRADVVIVGEIHDNGQHHIAQAEIVRDLQPRAIIFEMLDSSQAARITPEIRHDPQALAGALNWADSGWPDFAHYAALFSVAPDAKIYGAALPRGEARAAMQRGVAETFGAAAGEYGLTDPLPDDQQSAREDMQFTAHCDALPRHILPDMVALQRLRDAMLAQAVMQALDETGPPVIVITGNGHARWDWGVPYLLNGLAPNINIYVIGQGEDGQIPEGGFDAILDAPAQSRPDPCEAFR